MPTNQYLPFAFNSGANVLTPVAYAASSIRPSGFGSGIADSATFNSPIRQATTMASAVAQVIGLAGFDTLDDGDAAGLRDKLAKALRGGAWDTAATAGSANAQTANLTPAPANNAELSGAIISITPGFTNTGSMTLALNGLPALTVYNLNGGALAASQVVTGSRQMLFCTGTSFILLTPSALPYGLINVRIFGASGTYTPTAGTSKIIVEAVGGGGAGGGAAISGAGNACVGIAGNAGAYGRGLYTSGFSSVAMTIGAGGFGNAGAAGGNGGTTSFGALLSCPGGPGGGTGLVQSGSASGGNGTSSGNPSGANIIGGEGGIGAVSFGFTTGQVAYGGQGGASYFGAGGKGQQANLNGLGTITPGAGGGGTIGVQNTGALTGGGGGAGYIIVHEFGLS